MKPIRSVAGRGVPLPRSDVDTDQIIPSEWLKRVERSGFGQGLFADWRSDPGFVLNQPRYQGAKILVTGPNFGTGSSREHAVWALLDYGFEAVVSARFADIFRTNCTKAGLLPVRVEPDVARALLEALEADPSQELSIDVERTRIVAPAAGVDTAFLLDDHTRRRFLEGLDEIGLTLRYEADITAYERARPDRLPATSP